MFERSVMDLEATFKKLLTVAIAFIDILKPGFQISDRLELNWNALSSTRL